MEHVSGAFDLVKLITDNGILVVIAAVFLINQSRQNNRSERQQEKAAEHQSMLINQIFDKYQNTNDSILDIVKNMTITIGQLKDVLTRHDLGSIRTFIKYALRFIPHEVCVFIADFKEKNNLDDKDDVEKSLRTKLENLYKSFVADIDVFPQYKGHYLSFFCNTEWIDLIFDFCIKAIYDGKPYHRDGYLPKLNNLYEKIKVDFFENLNKK